MLALRFRSRRGLLLLRLLHLLVARFLPGFLPGLLPPFLSLLPPRLLDHLPSLNLLWRTNLLTLFMT